jgi:hypothetical protein
MQRHGNPWGVGPPTKALRTGAVFPVSPCSRSRSPRFVRLGTSKPDPFFTSRCNRRGWRPVECPVVPACATLRPPKDGGTVVGQSFQPPSKPLMKQWEMAVEIASSLRSSQ